MTAFERYFKEADGDDEDQVTVKVAPRKNRGTDYGSDNPNGVTVAPRANRGTNYSPDDTDDDAEPVNTQDTQTDDTQDTAPDNNQDTNQDDTQNTGDDDTATDYGANDDGGDDNEAGDDGADGDADEDDGDDDDQATDYGADSGDDTGDNADNADAQGDEQDSNGENSGERAEKQKKFHMYKRFLRLYNSIEDFLDKIQGVVKNDATQNAVIKTVYNNLSDVHDNMFDYITIRYKTQTYVQVLIYFETVISIVKLNFELLRNNKINLRQDTL
jgi:hypothetical protein